MPMKSPKIHLLLQRIGSLTSDVPHICRGTPQLRPGHSRPHHSCKTQKKSQMAPPPTHPALRLAGLGGAPQQVRRDLVVQLRAAQRTAGVQCPQRGQCLLLRRPAEHAVRPPLPGDRQHPAQCTRLTDLCGQDPIVVPQGKQGGGGRLGGQWGSWRTKAGVLAAPAVKEGASQRAGVSSNSHS